MKEKTFEELIKEKTQRENFFMLTDVGEKFMVQLLQQVREATKAEIENKANEYGEYGTADYVHEMPTDRIKIKE